MIELDLQEMRGWFGFGVAGNFAGHLEQAGEAVDFVNVASEGSAPKGIFPWYSQGQPVLWWSPDPRMVLELMALWDVPPERTLVVGDTTHDLQMALNAGCASVGVSYGAHEPDAFHALNPRHVAHSVRDLHDWLLQNA